MIRKQGLFSQAHEWGVPDSLVHSGYLGGKYLGCSPLPWMVKKTEKSKRSEMIKLWWYLSVCMAYDLEKIVWKGLLFSGEIQFYSAAKEEPMNHLKHLLLCLYSSVDIWFLPNQQLVHSFLPVVSYYGATGLFEGNYSLCQLLWLVLIGLNQTFVLLIGSEMSCDLALSQSLSTLLASYLVLWSECLCPLSPQIHMLKSCPSLWWYLEAQPL